MTSPASISTLKFLLPAVAWMIAATASAAPHWNFSNADWQGWTSANFQKITIQKGRGIVGVTKKGPYLYSPEMQLDADVYSRLQLRVKTPSPAVRIYFSRPGFPFAESRCFGLSLTPEQQSGLRGIVIDCGQNPEWRGTVTQLRIDLATRNGLTVELASVRFLEKSTGILVNGDFSEPGMSNSAVPEGWTGKAETIPGRSGVILAASGSMYSDLIELQDTKPLHCKLDVTGTVFPQFEFYDIYGKTLESVSGETETDGESVTFFPPPLAAFLKVRLVNPDKMHTAMIRSVKIMPETNANPWNAKWIWFHGAKECGKVFFRKEFNVDDPNSLQEAKLQATGDDGITLFLNGRQLECGNGENWRQPDVFDVKTLLRAGINVLTAQVVNRGDYGGFLAELKMLDSEGKEQVVGSDGSWRCCQAPQLPSGWNSPGGVSVPVEASVELGPVGCPPWGTLAYSPIERMTVAVKDLKLPSAVSGDDVLQLIPVLYDGKPHSPGIFPRRPEFSLWLDNGKMRLRVMDHVLVNGKELAEGKTITLPATELPVRCLQSGTWRVGMALDGARLISGAGNEQKFVVKTAEKISIPEVKIISREGIPQFEINRDPPVPVDHYLFEMNGTDAEWTEIKNCIDAGFKGIWFHYSGWEYSADGKGFDFGKLDQLCTEILLRSPDVHFVICIGMSGNLAHAMRTWEQNHQEELERNSDGSSGIKSYRGTLQNAPSLASEAWLREGDRLLAALIEHLTTQPYGARVIGLAPCSGITWEWMYWGAQRKEFVCYSKPFQSAFRNWVKSKYDGNVAAVAERWKKKIGSFDEITVPSPKERAAGGMGDLKNPESGCYVRDFQECLSDVTANAICRFADTIKRKSGGRLLTGAYYGYTNYVLDGEWIPRIGHFSLNRVLNCPAVDMLMAPTRYADRGLGEAGGFMIPSGSLRLHDKLYLNESDIRTIHSGDQGHGKIPTLSGSRSVLEREMAAALVSGASPRWYDFSGGWIGGDPRLVAVTAQLMRLEQTIAANSQTISDRSGSIAVFTDEKALNDTVMGSELNRMLISDQYPQLYRSGLGVDMFLMADLEKVADSYRFLIFLNPLSISEEQYEVIRKLKNNRRTLMFFYGVGVVGKDAISTRMMSSLLEMPFAMDRSNQRWSLTLTENGKRYLNHPLPSCTTSSAAFSPVFYPEKGGRTLALLQDGKPGLVVLERRDYRIVYSAVPALPASWLAGLAGEAGIHVYNRNFRDATWACGNLLAVHSLEGGWRTLYMPFRTGKVVELITNKAYPVENGQFTCFQQAGFSSIFLGYPKCAPGTP